MHYIYTFSDPNVIAPPSDIGDLSRFWLSWLGHMGCILPVTFKLFGSSIFWLFFLLLRAFGLLAAEFKKKKIVFPICWLWANLITGHCHYPRKYTINVSTVTRADTVFTPDRFKSCLFFNFLLIYSKTFLVQLPRPYSFKKISWPPHPAIPPPPPTTSCEDAAVFLSGIRPSTQRHGPKVKVTAPSIKKNGNSELSGFYHSVFSFLTSYCVSKYKEPREITDEIIN